MYHQWTPSKKTKTISQKRSKQSRIEVKSRLQMQQLLLSMGLFAVVFVGEGVFPEEMQAKREFLQQQLVEPTDFRSAFHKLGTALADEDSFLGEVGTFFLDVFTGADVEGQQIEFQESVTVFQETTFIPPILDLKIELVPANPEIFEEILPEVTYGSSDVGTEFMAVGTVISSISEGFHYSDITTDSTIYDSLFTEDKLYLGERETISPVFSMITSEFGLRTDPYTGEITLHRGADLRGTEGTSISAWSEGVVETVGETSIVGRYVRINHGDEVSSFYAHCSEILVEKGEIVEMGQEIALIGSTGQVTGPHLHFEIMWQDCYLNPLHYIEYEGIVQYDS